MHSSVDVRELVLVDKNRICGIGYSNSTSNRNRSAMTNASLFKNLIKLLNRILTFSLQTRPIDTAHLFDIVVVVQQQQSKHVNIPERSFQFIFSPLFLSHCVRITMKPNPISKNNRISDACELNFDSSRCNHSKSSPHLTFCVSFKVKANCRLLLNNWKAS